MPPTAPARARRLRARGTRRAAGRGRHRSRSSLRAHVARARARRGDRPRVSGRSGSAAARGRRTRGLRRHLLDRLELDDPRRERRARAAPARLRARRLRDGVPSFGSCWAAQFSVAAAGGRCAPNPKGREFGVACAITLSEAGRAHPLYRDKPARFDAFTSHADHVVELCDGATLLASNAWSGVQAVERRARPRSLLGAAVSPGVRPARGRVAVPLAQGGAGRAGQLGGRRGRRRLHRGSGSAARRPGALRSRGVARHHAGAARPQQRAIEVRNWLGSLEAEARGADDRGGQGRSRMPVIVPTTALLIPSNLFMTFAGTHTCRSSRSCRRSSRCRCSCRSRSSTCGSRSSSTTVGGTLHAGRDLFHLPRSGQLGRANHQIARKVASASTV